MKQAVIREKRFGRSRTMLDEHVGQRHVRAALVSACCMLAVMPLLLPRQARAADAESCPNAAVRIGFAAALPDCRAYELVSPPGAEPNVQFTGFREVGSPLAGDGAASQVQASNTGEGFSYVTPYPPLGSPSSGEYLRVTRTGGGWSAEQMIPPQSTSYSVTCGNAYIAAYSPDLAKAILGDGVGQPGSTVKLGVLRCGTDEPKLVVDEPREFQNLFLGEREAGPYQLIDRLDQAPEGTAPADAWFQAASADLSHVVFNESAPLTSDAPAGFALYEWASGSLYVVTRLPDGSPVEGRLANGYEPEATQCCGAETFTHAVSADGSRISFVANGNLYLRVNADRPQSTVNGEGACTEPTAGCTLQVDAAEGGGESGAGRFMWATPDGTKIFFTDENRLTNDSTAAPGEPDLYEYDLSSAEGARLTDLTVDSGEAADVLGVSGISDHGDHVYFVATGVLDDAANSQGDEAVQGQPNLYLRHGGTTTFVATLDGAPNEVTGQEHTDGSDWEAIHLTARTTPDGAFLAFNSAMRLTGYDNTDVASGEADDEIFLYEASGQQLRCVSCSPTGAPSTAYAKIPVPIRPEFGGAGPFDMAGYLQRSLSDDGRVFFHTGEKLLAGAVNGLANVYEYAQGQLHLISAGTSGRASYFYDASPSGDDVFFISSQELPSGDQGSGFKVYDARVGGGFPASPTPPECGGDACRGAIQGMPPLSAPGTVNPLGSGNLAPPAAAPPPRKTQAQIRRERLARTLKGCRKKHNKHKRVLCERQARKRYGARARKPKSSASARSASAKLEREVG